MSHWYYHKAHGLVAGPFSDGELREHRESGTVRDTTLVWQTGWRDWTTFAEIWKSGAEPALDSAVEEPPAIPFRLAETVADSKPVDSKYAACSVCRDTWPEHLLFSAGRIRMCAKCLKTREERQKRKNEGYSDVFGVDVGTTSWLLKLVLLGLALAGVVIFSLSFLGSSGK